MKDLYTRITLMCRKDDRKWLDRVTPEQLAMLEAVIKNNPDIDFIAHMIYAYTSKCDLAEVHDMVEAEINRKDEPERPKSFWIKKPYLFDTDGDHEAKAVYCPDEESYIDVLKGFVLGRTYGMSISGYGTSLESHKDMFDRGNYAFCLESSSDRFDGPDWYLFAKIAHESSYYNDNHEYWGTSTDYKISVDRLSTIKDRINNFLSKFDISADPNS